MSLATVYGIPIANVAVWLKRGTGFVTSVGGSTAAADQSTPAGWNDSSGNGRNATVNTGGGTAQLWLNGEGFNRACLQLFGGANVSIPVGSLNMAQCAAVCTYRRLRGDTNTQGSNAIVAAKALTMNFGSGNGLLVNCNGTGVFFNGTGTPNNLICPLGVVDTDQPGIQAWVSDAANSQFSLYFNNVKATETLALSGTQTTLTLGTSVALGSGFASNGYLSEVVVFNTTPTPTQLATVFKYLNATNDLPSTYGQTRIALGGTSLTFGYDPSNTVLEPWSTAPSWHLSRSRPDLQFVNAGGPGGTASGFATSVSTWIGTYLSSGGVQVTNAATLGASLELGTTDIVNGRTAAQISADLTTSVAAIRAAGVKVLISTIIARDWTASNTSGLTQAQGLAIQAAVNSYILNGSTGADNICHLDAVPQLQDPTDTTYFKSDQTHLTQAGSSVVAGMLKSSMDVIYPSASGGGSGSSGGSTIINNGAGVFAS